MKYLYLGILILALLVAGCFYSAWEITRRSQAVAEPLAFALSSLRDGNEAAARAAVEAAASEWEAHESLLAALVSHDRTDRVGQTLAVLPWLRGDELIHAAADALQAVRAMAELERVNLRNIF